MQFSTVFKEGNEDSPFSVRRFISFILVIDSIFNTVFAMIHKVDDWHIFLVIMGVPLLVATLLLFCTTVNDVVELTTNIKRTTIGEKDGK